MARLFQIIMAVSLLFLGLYLPIGQAFLLLPVGVGVVLYPMVAAFVLRKDLKQLDEYDAASDVADATQSDEIRQTRLSFFLFSCLGLALSLITVGTLFRLLNWDIQGWTHAGYFFYLIYQILYWALFRPRGYETKSYLYLTISSVVYVAVLVWLNF